MGLTVAFFIIVFWIKGVLMLDPDFGWHLQVGELILKSGIPKIDPFSYTMPSYPFVDHEWLTNVVLAKLYPIIRTEGLAIIFSFLAMVALITQAPFPIKKWSFVPFVLVGGSLFPFIGIRPQIISWLFFSFLILVLFKVYFETSQLRHSGKLEGRIQNLSGQGVAAARDSGQARMTVLKWRFTLPFLFLAWSSLHGGFGVGLAALLIVTATRMWELRKILYRDIVLLFLCAGATLVNPYGIRLWWELWMSISDTSLRWSISEWNPAVFTLIFTLWVFVTFSAMLVLKYRKKFPLSQFVLYFILLIAGLSSIRHIPLWLLLALPMTIDAMIWFAEEAKFYKGAQERLNKIYTIFAICTVIVVFVESTMNLEGTKSSYSSYPKQAVEFLAKNRSCGQVFSTYAWGGYLIWKLPDKKVFIDGRMPSWRWESAPTSESGYAFDEYNKILGGEIPVQNAIAKYNIDTFLLPTAKKKKDDIFKKLRFLEAKILGRKLKDEKKFVKQLIDGGVVEIYKDSTAVIYRDKKHSTQCANPI